MFISALTESQMVSAVLTFGVLLLWAAVGFISRNVEEPFRGALRYLSYDAHLDDLMTGALDLKALVFFASIIVFAIVCTHRAVEADRWT